jgi:fucose 4-O-acetylase-like acetyltransferase
MQHSDNKSTNIFSDNNIFVTSQKISTKNMKEKNRQFLLLQAIAIILVLIGHKGGVGFEKLTAWFPIYAYHMPLFIFISGYFFSLNNLNNIQQYINKNIVVR